jgi:hypothetical protein
VILSICPNYGRLHARELFDRADSYGVGKVCDPKYSSYIVSDYPPPIQPFDGRGIEIQDEMKIFAD